MTVCEISIETLISFDHKAIPPAYRGSSMYYTYITTKNGIGVNCLLFYSLYSFKYDILPAMVGKGFYL